VLGFAVRQTQAQIRANQLLVIVPQLRWISTELDAALESDNASLARRQLDVWRSQAGHVHGILSNVDSNESDLLQALNESVGLAAAAGTALLQNQHGPALRRCSKARAAIGVACDRLTVWVGENSTRVPSGDGNNE
jgi:hypothetical protein